jgi:hypothetical protein
MSNIETWIACVFLLLWSYALVYATRRRDGHGMLMFGVGLVAFAVLAVPRIASADTGQGTSVIGGDARGGIVDLIMAQVVAGVGLGLTWLWGKVRHSSTARKVLTFTQQHQFAQQLAQAGVDLATELKHQAISEGTKIAGKALQSEAVSHAIDLLKKAKLPAGVEQAIREEMTKIVLARLGASRRVSPTPRPLVVAPLPTAA